MNLNHKYMEGIEKVADAYRKGGTPEIVQACKELSIPEGTLEFCKDCYTRKLVWSDTDKDFSIYILCWAPYQQSGLHDHPDKGCFMYLLRGGLAITNYNELEYGTYGRVEQGDWCVQKGAKQLHNVINGEMPSVSLHIYSPVSYTPKFYDRPPPPSFWM